jgi:ankyrin repeat protein
MQSHFVARLRQTAGTAMTATFRHNQHVSTTHGLFLQFPILVVLLIVSHAQSQTSDSLFLRGQLEINGDKASLTVDSDHSNLKITNPEAVRAEKSQRVILHATSTKDGIRVISSASTDDRNKPDDFSFAAIVAEHKDAAMVEHLLQLGANPNAKTQDGIPALVSAMGMGDQALMPVTGFDPNVEIAALLLNHGANPDALNKNWQTPLMAASSFGDEKLVKLFVDHKANVNIGNRFGMTALMYARSSAKVRMLIAAGASVNDKSITGETALYYSTQRADPDAVKALIEAGANVNVKNNRKMSPLHLAQIELEADRSPSSQNRGPEHEKQVERVMDLLVAAGALSETQ